MSNRLSSCKVHLSSKGMCKETQSDKDFSSRSMMLDQNLRFNILKNKNFTLIFWGTNVEKTYFWADGLKPKVLWLVNYWSNIANLFRGFIFHHVFKALAYCWKIQHLLLGYNWIIIYLQYLTISLYNWKQNTIICIICIIQMQNLTFNRIASSGVEHKPSA